MAEQQTPCGCAAAKWELQLTDEMLKQGGDEFEIHTSEERQPLNSEQIAALIFTRMLIANGRWRVILQRKY
jgi:hypothetical protein